MLLPWIEATHIVKPVITKPGVVKQSVHCINYSLEVARYIMQFKDRKEEHGGAVKAIRDHLVS